MLGEVPWYPPPRLPESSAAAASARCCCGRAALFLGTRRGENLAAIYAGADAFVFPSRTDTYGLVLLEALASGLPIAGYPVAATRRSVADHDLAARQVEGQERLDVFFDRQPSDREEHRTRHAQIAAAAAMEQPRIDAT